jgi:hypothetical protein
MSTAVMCLVKSSDQAERIVRALQDQGFSPNEISVLFPDRVGTRDFAHEQNTKAPEGATVGAGTGGLLGGTLGWLVGAGALAIPGLGPFIAAGPILAALAGAGAGAAAGGLTGALIGMGIPEFEAKQYEGKLREGNILISAHAVDSEAASRAKKTFEAHHAEGITSKGEVAVPKPSAKSGYVNP